MAAYAGAEDMINLGAYRIGSNPAVDDAINKHVPIEDFLMQDIDEPSSLEDTLTAMSEIAEIEIPPEEMTDKNAKVFANSRPSVAGKGKKQASAGTQEDSAKALNSVAALFSSIPGMGSLGLNQSQAQ
jgi:flagellum-specific ATP synthase